jgi:hypothetical protein
MYREKHPTNEGNVHTILKDPQEWIVRADGLEEELFYLRIIDIQGAESEIDAFALELTLGRSGF